MLCFIKKTIEMRLWNLMRGMEILFKNLIIFKKVFIQGLDPKIEFLKNFVSYP